MNERAIFDAAVEIQDPAQRRAFLDKACGEDAELRARIEALLAAHEGVGSFLDLPVIEQVQPGTSSPVDRTTDFSPQTRGEEEGDEDDIRSIVLSFLQPSQKPGSIGLLGHYEVLKILGQGGFGVVLKAFDEKLHRHVAIKMMNPRLAATSPPRKRFLREARAAAAIRHENIVQVYSVEEQPLPYLVMEYISGGTLQQKLNAKGPLSTTEVLHLGRQIAAGLAAAHASGLIHRDIKPGNILIEEGAEQKVKITDFGMARAADDASMTRSGVVSGTPMYMAPEQAQGQTLDHRADLFSLGSVLYQMACGRPPFRATSAIAVLRRVVEDIPRPMQEILPEIPEWLVAIVTKLHAKKPEERFQTAKEVAELLGQIQNQLQAGVTVTAVRQLGLIPAAPVASRAADSLAPATAQDPKRGVPKIGRKAAWGAALLLPILAGLFVLEWQGGTHLTPLARQRQNPDKRELQNQQPLVTKPVDDLEDAVATDPDRRAAEWVLSIGGSVTVVQGDETRVVLKPADLPVGPWRLTIVSLATAGGKATNRGLANLSGCTNLKILNLGGMGVTDDGLAHLKGLKGLTDLVLDNAKLSPAGLEQLKDFSDLVLLNLNFVPVTDADLAKLTTLGKLTSLTLVDSKVTDEGLRHLKAFPDLQELGLYGTPITDAGVAQLAELKNLTNLSRSVIEVKLGTGIG